MSDRRNDFATVTQLVEDNIRLARFLAGKWAKTIGEDEAFSAALAGLQRAAEQWDHGAPFGAFAGVVINRAIGVVNRRRKAVKRGGRAVTISLDQPVGEEGSATVGELVADRSGETEVAVDEWARLRELIGRLPRREGYVLTRRFGLDGEPPESLEAVARVFGLTRERIRQIEEKSLRLVAKMHGEKRAVKVTRGQEQVYSRLGVDHGGFDPEADAMPAARIRRSRADRSQATDACRAYFRAWRKANREYLVFYRALTREKTLAWKRNWHRLNRDRLNAKQRARYANDFVYSDKARAHAKAYRDANLAAVNAQKAAYRAAHRQELRDSQNARTAALVPSYVREQLAKKTGRAPDSFTFEELHAHREHLAGRRADLKTRPPCPHCGRPGRKDGHFTPSGRQRYSCRHCKRIYGIPK